MSEPTVGVPGDRFQLPDNEPRLPENEPTGPDYSDLTTQPDIVHRPPLIVDPEFPIPDDEATREELEIALERAKLVAEDCSTILQPAVQAMRDGAWVSRRADEFSLALDDNANKVAEGAQGPVDIIENALNRKIDGDGDDVFHVPDPRLPTPMPGSEV